MAYYNLNPFGDVRADLRSAQQVYAVAKPGNKKLTLDDCRLPFPRKGKRKRQSVAEMKAAFEAFAATFK